MHYTGVFFGMIGDTQTYNYILLLFLFMAWCGGRDIIFPAVSSSSDVVPWASIFFLNLFSHSHSHPNIHSLTLVNSCTSNITLSHNLSIILSLVIVTYIPTYLEPLQLIMRNGK
jgi:hypothetical protein